MHFDICANFLNEKDILRIPSECQTVWMQTFCQARSGSKLLSASDFFFDKSPPEIVILSKVTFHHFIGHEN